MNVGAVEPRKVGSRLSTPYGKAGPGLSKAGELAGFPPALSSSPVDIAQKRAQVERAMLNSASFQLGAGKVQVSTMRRNALASGRTESRRPALVGLCMREL